MCLITLFKEGGGSVARSKVGQVRRRTQIRHRQKRRLKNKKLMLQEESVEKKDALDFARSGGHFESKRRRH